MGTIERFESECSARLLFHEAMVLFNYVVEVFALPNLYRLTVLLIVSLDGCGIRPAGIDVYFHWSTVIAYSLL